MAQVSIRNVEKYYGSYHAVRGVTLDIPDHAFVVLVGPSGCGKSTVLRMIAGLEEISHGELRIGDKVVNQLPPGERDIAMVFQNYALYPHMTVYENIAFGLRQRKTPKAEMKRRIDEVAHMLGISQLMHRRPRELSGGQRQRVAMGRAMVRKPSLFLFDEPLSNLDAKLRMHMRTEMKRLHQTMPTSTIYVTHDQIEAMTLADLVVVMNEGRIEQHGLPQDIYHHPQSRFVAGFIGSPAMNFFEATVTEEGENLFLCLRDDNKLPLPAAKRSAYRNRIGQPVILGIRPEHFSLRPAADSTAQIQIVIDVVELLGPEVLLYWKSQHDSFCARLNSEFASTPGQKLTLYPDMNKAHLFDSTSGQSI